MIKPQFTVLDDDGCDVSIPCQFAVCPRCEGSGVHDHPAFSNGISSDEFDENPDFREDYLKGRYDVPCEQCHGNRVVSEPVKDALSPDQQRWLKAHYQGLAKEAAERRMRNAGYQF